MITVWAFILVVSNLVWLGLTLMTLPGNWLMVLSTAGLAWYYWPQRMFSVWTLLAIVLLAIAGEFFESFTSTIQVRRAGGSKMGGLGSLVGALVGFAAGTFIIPIPILGSLIGACVGAFVFTLLFEMLIGRKRRQALASGSAAAKGRLFGTVIKFGIGAVIYIIIAVAAFV